MNPKHWQHVRAAFAADRPEGREGPAADQGKRQGPAPAVNAPSPQVDADGATRAAAQGHGVPDLPATRIDSIGTTSLPIGIDAPLAIQPDAPRWGDFLLLEELGRGAFGVVYRAWDPALERDIALKLIDVSRLPAQRGDTLLREGRMLARVRHTNVVTVYSTQRIGAKVGLAMECVRGRTLAHLVAQNGALGAQEAALIGVTLCDALAAVHRVGLVHRDVKASNVMREDGGRIVLMDFGAGHDIEPERTHASIIAGTPAYMSPEVLMGAPATPASDIYSLGVLLFHLVTGQFPVDGASMESLADAHRQGTRRTLSHLRPDLPEAFVRAVESALIPERMARVPTALALKQSLVATLRPAVAVGRRRSRAPGEHTPPSRPLPNTDRLTVPVAIQRTVSIAAGAVLLCTVVGVVNTLQFNAVLGRTGVFASERLWNHPMYGAQALMGPLWHMVLAFLLFNIIWLVLRLISKMLPRVTAGVVAAGQRGAGRFSAAGFGDPATVGQAFSVVGLLAALAVTSQYGHLLGAYLTRADTGAVSELALLALPEGAPARNPHTELRFALSAVLVFLFAGLMLMRRLEGAGVSNRDARPLLPVAAIGTVAVIVILIQSFAWRTVWGSEFPEVRLGGHMCLIIGQSDSDFLLHCPGETTPRKRVVRRGDTRLEYADTLTPLFGYYAARLQ